MHEYQYSPKVILTCLSDISIECKTILDDEDENDPKVQLVNCKDWQVITEFTLNETTQTINLPELEPQPQPYIILPRDNEGFTVNIFVVTEETYQFQKQHSPTWANITEEEQGILRKY